MRTSLVLSGICVIALLSAGCVSTSRCTIRPLETSDITGSWIGYDQDCLLFYRLTLADNNQGTCVTLFVDNTPNVYLIRKWGIRDGGLDLELAPARRGSEPITIDVLDVDQREMRVRVKGVERSWSHHAFFHREDDVLKFTKQAQQIAKDTKWEAPTR